MTSESTEKKPLFSATLCTPKHKSGSKENICKPSEDFHCLLPTIHHKEEARAINMNLFHQSLNCLWNAYTRVTSLPSITWIFTPIFNEK